MTAFKYYVNTDMKYWLIDLSKIVLVNYATPEIFKNKITNNKQEQK